MHASYTIFSSGSVYQVYRRSFLTGALDKVVIVPTLDHARAEVPLGSARFARMRSDPPGVLEMWV